MATIGQIVAKVQELSPLAIRGVVERGRGVFDGVREQRTIR